MTAAVVVVGIAMAVALVLVLAGTSVSARDVSWIAGTTRVDPSEAYVYSRYLRRHRRHRVVGGLFGMTLAVIVGIRWSGAVFFGIGQAGPLGDLLFATLAGVLLGALSAETFRLSEPRSAAASASLSERAGSGRSRLVAGSRLLALAALVVGAAVALTGHGGGALAIAALGLLVHLVAAATLGAISARRRPVMSNRAHVVDARVRAFASTSVAWLQLALAALVLAWTTAQVPGSGAPGDVLRLVVVLAALVLGMVAAHRAAPRPTRAWTPAPA